MLIPLLVQNLGPAPPVGIGALDFTVVEVVRDYRLEGAAIIIDSNLAGFTSAIGVFREDTIAAGSHTVMIVLDGYNTFSGTFIVATGFTTTEIFELVPFTNRFLTNYRFDPYRWEWSKYGSRKHWTGGGEEVNPDKPGH
jgi:hypothetical protein